MKKRLRTDFGEIPDYLLKRMEENVNTNPTVLPQWKKDKLFYIKEVSKYIVENNLASVEDVQKTSKYCCGVSNFINLQYCTDVMLDRLIDALDAISA